VPQDTASIETPKEALKKREETHLIFMGDLLAIERSVPS
jgi:hypothetical protein